MVWVPRVIFEGFGLDSEKPQLMSRPNIFETKSNLMTGSCFKPGDFTLYTAWSSLDSNLIGSENLRFKFDYILES